MRGYFPSAPNHLELLFGVQWRVFLLFFPPLSPRSERDCELVQQIPNDLHNDKFFKRKYFAKEEVDADEDLWLHIHPTCSTRSALT
jgi:hypothetical protein